MQGRFQKHIDFPMEPTEPIFKKLSYLREKGGGADFFPG
jgi:hypothetical protein